MISARTYRRAAALDVLDWRALTPVEALALAFAVGAIVTGALFHVPVGHFLWTSLMLSSLLAAFSFGVVRVTRMDPVLGRWLAGVSERLGTAPPPALLRVSRRLCPGESFRRFASIRETPLSPGHRERGFRDPDDDGPSSLRGARAIGPAAAQHFLPGIRAARDFPGE